MYICLSNVQDYVAIVTVKCNVCVTATLVLFVFLLTVSQMECLLLFVATDVMCVVTNVMYVDICCD